MFDALGFKGIWDRAARATPPWNVLDKLDKLVNDTRDVQGHIEAANDSLAAQFRDIGQTKVQTLLLSDTIVVASSAEDIPRAEPQNGDWVALISVSNVVAGILAHAASPPEPRLAYRGCVSFGSFEIRSNFVVGPAVDEAATLADSAEGAFVWLSPSAKQFVDRISLNGPPEFLRPWSVPLKGGHAFDTYVISPYAGVTTKSRAALFRAIQGTFVGTKLDVQLKRQHTTEFLKRELDRLQQSEADPLESNPERP